MEPTRIPISHPLIIKFVFTELCLLKVLSLPNMSKAHEQTFSIPLRKFEIQVIINVLQTQVCGREISAKSQLSFLESVSDCLSEPVWQHERKF